MNSFQAMEQRLEKPAIPATAEAIATQTQEQYSPIKLVSKQQVSDRAKIFYIISGNAIEFSTFLRGKVSFEKQRQQVDSASQLAPIEIDYARNQIAFIAAILNFFTQCIERASNNTRYC